MKQPKLSVIIPAYNEAENIKAGVLEQVNNYLQKQKYSYEVLIVNDGSADQTAQLISSWIRNKPNFYLINNPHQGKALTVISGMLKARGEIVLFTDMDQSTPLNQIEKFFPKFDEDFNVVIGSRGGRKGAPLLRKFNAWGFSFLRNLILGLPLKDTQCGFKAFDKKSVTAVFPQMLELRKGALVSGAALNAGFDVETLYLAKKSDLKIAEVSVDWHYVGTARFNLLKDALDAVKDMLKIRFNDLRGKYFAKLHG